MSVICLNPYYRTAYQDLQAAQWVWIYKFHDPPFLTLEREWIEVEIQIVDSPHQSGLLREIGGTRWVALHVKPYGSRTQDLIFLGDSEGEVREALARAILWPCSIYP